MVTGYLVQEFWNKEPKTNEEENASQCENAGKQSALFLAFIRNFLGGKCRQHHWTRTNTDEGSEAWSIYSVAQSNALHMWKVSQPPLLPSCFQKLRYEVYWATLRDSLLAVMMQWKIMHLQRTEVITVCVLGTIYIILSLLKKTACTIQPWSNCPSKKQKLGVLRQNY